MSSCPTITLEEHYFSKTLRSEGKLDYVLENFPQKVTDKLLDLDDLRISEMHAGNVTVQVISHGPGAASQAPSDVAAANDELHQACKERPDRFKAFAALSMAHPEAAAEELRRCVKDLGFLGALVDSHLPDGRYYEDEYFWPVFEAAQELDVPFYIHPTFPVPAVQKALFDGPWDERTAFMLGTSAWGWHMDVGLHVLRLHAAGIFDRFPKLKIVIGHMGEMWPGMLDRVHQRSVPWSQGEAVGGGKKKNVYEMWNENIWVTTSSFFSLDPMATILRTTKPDRIMYSVDYPFSDTRMGKEFLEKLKTSGMVTEEVFHGIAYKNAEKLLGIKAVPIA